MVYKKSDLDNFWVRVSRIHLNIASKALKGSLSKSYICEDFFIDQKSMKRGSLTLRCRNGSGRPGKDFFLKFMSILLNIWLRCSGYFSATYGRLLSWIDPEKKTFEVGGAPVSLDYAKFLGCHFRLDFQFFLLCLDRFTILGRYFSEYVSFATRFYHFFHSLKNLYCL